MAGYGNQQGFPNVSAPLVDNQGQIQQAWLQLLIQLWARTGAGPGISSTELVTKIETLSNSRFVDSDPGEDAFDIPGPPGPRGLKGDQGPMGFGFDGEDGQESYIALMSSAASSGGLPTIGAGDVLGNSTAGSATATDTTVTALLDRNFSSTQGSILYRDSSVWKALGPGSAGNVLQTNGAGSNPTWAAGSGGGGNFTLLGSSVVSGSSTSQVTFSGISNSYQNLRLIIFGRTLATDNIVNNFGLIFNNDTTAAHYPSTFYSGNPGSGTIPSSSSYGGFGNNMISSASSNTIFGISETNISGYGQTSNNIVWDGSFSASPTSRILNTTSYWLPTSLAAITSITVTAVNNSLSVTDWAAGTTMWLYGY